MRTLWQDLRYALRLLGRAPGFTSVAVLSLALGIGANAAIFAFVDAVLLKSLPVADPGRLVLVRARHAVHGVNTSFGYPFFHELERGNDVFSGMVAHFQVLVNLTSNDTTQRQKGELVNGGFFQTLGVRPALGRLLTPEDDGAEGAHPVCVISYQLWQSRFGGDPNILEKTISLNTQPFRIVGVTEPAFRGPELQGNFDLQIPMSMTKLFLNMERDGKGWSWLQIMGRLKPGVSMQHAQASIDSLARGLDAGGPKFVAYFLVAGRQGFGGVRGRFQNPVIILMALSGLVLLIACANLANLLVAKAAERRREIAIRLSLGATRVRLIRQLLAESLLLAILGGACGLLLATLLDRTLAAMLSSANSPIVVRPDPLVIAFTLGLSLMTAILFGLAPALEATRAPRPSGGGGHSWLRRGLIAVQITICLVLVFGAGLFARTLRSLQTVDLGFRTDRIVLLSMNPGQSGYDSARSDAFFTELLRRTRAIPGVERASLASISALSGGMFAATVQVPGYTPRGGVEPNNNFNTVSDNYFQTLQIPVLRGRDFNDHDTKTSSLVAIVNERFVEFYWPGQDPIGRHVKALGKDVEIVGLVKTAKYQRLREDPQITIYLPLSQRPTGQFTLTVRTAIDPAAIIARVREQVRAIDPKLPVYNIATLNQQMKEQLSSERVLSLLSVLFGALAMLVAAAGLYGVIAYAVVGRTREIGVRMAIGARGRDVIRLFVGEIILLAGIGIAIGAPLALACARLLQSSLYGVKHNDAYTLAAAGTILLSVALIAALLPARKAARIDPAMALRHE